MTSRSQPPPWSGYPWDHPDDFRAFQGVIYRCAVRSLRRDPEAAQDLVQTVTILLRDWLEKGNELQDRRHLINWGILVARQQGARERTRTRQEQLSPFEDGLEPEADRQRSDDVEQWVTEHGSDVLARILDLIPTKDRDLLEQRYLRKRTLKDIGSEQGCSEVQIHRAERRALAALRRVFASGPDHPHNPKVRGPKPSLMPDPIAPDKLEEILERWSS